jgi:predicted RNase H-like HicB family nuclease
MGETGYLVVIERASESNYSAYSPDLPGCISTGPTVEETAANMAEAIGLHLDGMRSHGEAIPPPRAVARYVAS